MQDLHDDFPVCPVHGCGDLGMICDVGFVEQTRRTMKNRTFGVRGNSACDDQGNTAAGA